MLYTDQKKIHKQNLKVMILIIICDSNLFIFINEIKIGQIFNKNLNLIQSLKKFLMHLKYFKIII